MERINQADLFGKGGKLRFLEEEKLRIEVKVFVFVKEKEDDHRHWMYFAQACSLTSNVSFDWMEMKGQYFAC